MSQRRAAVESGDEKTVAEERERRCRRKGATGGRVTTRAKGTQFGTRSGTCVEAPMKFRKRRPIDSI